MTTQVRKNVMDMFIDGARRGFTIATTSLLPNVVMAFVIIQALKVTGLLEIVGRVCEPVMALWGLPGESATVLLAAVMTATFPLIFKSMIYSDTMISLPSTLNRCGMSSEAHSR